MKRNLALTLTLAALILTAAWGADARHDGWERGSAYNKLYNPKTVETVSGTIVSMDRTLRPMPGMGEGVAALVETADGRRINCHLGPIWFTQNFRDDWKAAPGDKVEIRGSMVDLGGARVMMVNWGRKGDHVMTVRNPEGVPVWDVKIEGF